MATQQDIHGLRELALFAGAGGGILGGKLLGWRTVCAVERDAYAAQVLAQRQNDGILPPFPIWSDVESFDGKPWRGIIDVVSGGFPCQDISVAGKGAGIAGERSGLWSEMARIIGEVRPRFAFIENSPALVNRGLDRVLADLASMGFDAEWGVLSAADVGAPHLRERIWILAYSYRNGCERSHLPLQQGRQKQTNPEPGGACQASAHSGFNRLEGGVFLGNGSEEDGDDERGKAARRIMPNCWQSDNPEPGILGVDDGMADWKYRIAAIGNGQVPLCAATAFRLLAARAGVE